MSEVGTDCIDDRLPMLVGQTVVGCENGAARVLLDLPSLTRQVISSRPPLNPAFDGTYLFEEGKGLWRIQATLPELFSHSPTPSQPGFARAIGGEYLAIAWEDHLEAGKIGNSSRVRIPAHPLPGQPLAIAGTALAWVESRNGDLDLYWVPNIDHPTVEILAGGPGHQHRPTQSGPFLAWVEPDHLTLLDTRTHTRQQVSAQTGFLHPPSLWGEILCWEERNADLDIRCSDGLNITLPGDQLAPWRSGPWLLYQQRSGGPQSPRTPVLATTPLTLTPNGPFHSQSCQGCWDLDWPAPGYQVFAEHKTPDGILWEPLGPLGTGPQKIQTPYPGSVIIRP